jgi:uncharacterized protein (TIGR00725 family)
MGSGMDEYDEYARPVGELLAKLGVNLLTGGGGGVMTAVSRAYVQYPRLRGICIGILPCESEEERSTPRSGYPNEFVELAIHTHLPYSGPLGSHDLSRNHINVLTSSAIVALPGGQGTASEISLALRYRKPIIVYSPVPGLVEHFPKQAERVQTIGDVGAFLRRYVGADVAKVSPSREKAERIKALIMNAFAAVERPANWALRGSHEGEEPFLLEKEFADKPDWRTLTAEFLDQAPGGYGSSLSFFSEEAFRYFLPAYLIADLDEALSSVDPVFYLCHGLDDETRNQAVNPRRYGRRTWFDERQHQFASFLPEEAGAIVAYLEYRASRDDFNRDRIAEAIRNYWRERTT